MSRHVVETDQRLSSSLLWKLQRRFYQEVGIEAWSQPIVPQYVTANAFIADAYARVVLGFFRDLAAGGLRPPIHIVELGAGPGRFAYLFLRRFAELHARSTLRAQPFRYVLTDVADANLAHGRSHPQLAPFIAAGQLEFAHFDAEHSTELRLDSGAVLSAANPAAPLVVLANYVFDAIPQDIFHVEAGRLYEGRVSATSSQADADPTCPPDLELDYQRVPAAAAPYDDASWNAILEDYRRWLPDGAIGFPSATLRCLARLRQLAKGPLMVLAGDKGYTRAEALVQRLEPAMTLHGSISMMLNFHAVADWVRRAGGHAMATAHRHASLSVNAFVLGEGDPAETRHAFEDHIEARGPDDFFNLKKAIDPHYAGFELVQLLALMRQSRHDATLLGALIPMLREQVPGLSPALAADLRSAVRRSWGNHFPIGDFPQEHDLALDLGILMLDMDDAIEALDYLERSLERHGPTARTLYTIALCHQRLGQLDRARAFVSRALDEDPDLVPAQELEQKLAG